MTRTKWLWTGVALVTLLFAVRHFNDPHRTALPRSVEGLSPLQRELDRLPKDERQLVADYLKRSRGEVLPPRFADPDAPLTARDFGEAIRLQRAFEEKMRPRLAEEAARRAKREAAFDVLRAALSVELVKREIVTDDPAFAHPVAVTTWRLRNRSSRTIAQASGSVTVRAASDPHSLMAIDGCGVDEKEPLGPDESREIRCGGVFTRAPDAEARYVAMPESDLVFAWEPKRIAYDDGEILLAGD